MKLLNVLTIATLLTGVTAWSQSSTNISSAITAKRLTEKEVFAAAFNGEMETVRKALVEGFSVNRKGDEERTLLMMAAFNGHTDVCRLLIQAGADVNQHDTTGTTPLICAASGPFTPTVKLLIENDAKVNLADTNEHFTPLMLAGAEGLMENCTLLLKHGADPTLTDVDGDTAASFASKAGHHAVAAMLNKAAETVSETKPAVEESDSKKNSLK